jgi:hypothetical protein
MKIEIKVDSEPREVTAKKTRAQEFLEEWVFDHIDSIFAFEQEVDDRHSECIEAAAEQGIAELELAQAASGDLHQYVREALREASVARLIYHSTIDPFTQGDPSEATQKE